MSSGKEGNPSADFRQEMAALHTRIGDLVRKRGIDGVLKLTDISTGPLLERVEIGLQNLLTPTIPGSVSIDIVALENGSYGITFRQNEIQGTEIASIVDADGLTILDKKVLGRVITSTMETIRGLNQIVINLDNII